MDEFLPLLARGEAYVEHEKPRKINPKDDDRLPSYEKARDMLVSKVVEISKGIEKIPSDRRVSDVVVSMRMTAGYAAKSYYPHSLIRWSGATDIGSKNWIKSGRTSKGKASFRLGKDVFLRVSSESLGIFLESLERRQNISSFVEDVRRVEDLFIEHNEVLLENFPPNWNDGRVELVFHPFGNLEEEVIEKFFKLFKYIGGEVHRIKYKSYAPGPLFMSVYCDRNILQNMVDFNAIRGAHPLKFKGLPDLRGFMSMFPLPSAPQNSIKSSISVGMFDGGVVDNHPLLNNYVTNRDGVFTLPLPQGLAHGTAVAGAILYGNIKEYGAGAVLPEPKISVESYRVLPVSDPTDIDLYEVIDVIEEVVPKRNDIQVYNLSMGPCGPIDDELSRFTYVLDSLSANGDKLFCVAVGNDGDLVDEADRRIQAPSDIINGLGVGAHTYNGGGIVERASYSSIGEGREGCKVKPDLTAFGGCEQHPFYLIGMDGRNKLLAAGTSFATPIVSGKAAELIGRFPLANALVARTLLIHSAIHPEGVSDKYLGYGVIPNSIEEILGCTKNKVTVMYKSQILPGKYAKIPIPFLKDINYSGKVNISWTIAIATKPNPNHTGDYTANCIEDYFYPNSNVYEFKSFDNNSTKLVDIVKDEEVVRQLEQEGWKQNHYPKTASGNQYETEEERRANLKWDTVVRKNETKLYSKISDPFLIAHGIDRNIVPCMGVDFINYSIAVTVNYLTYQGDAYRQTLKNYPKLEIARLRSLQEIMVPIK